MTKTKHELTGQFIGKTASGDSYPVYEFTTFLNSTTVHDTQTQWTPGVKVYQLPNGDAVSHISGNVYKIMRTGQEITLSPRI